MIFPEQKEPDDEDDDDYDGERFFAGVFWALAATICGAIVMWFTLVK